MRGRGEREKGREGEREGDCGIGTSPRTWFVCTAADAAVSRLQLQIFPLLWSNRLHLHPDERVEMVSRQLFRIDCFLIRQRERDKTLYLTVPKWRRAVKGLQTGQSRQQSIHPGSAASWINYSQCFVWEYAPEQHNITLIDKGHEAGPTSDSPIVLEY